MLLGGIPIMCQLCIKMLRTYYEWTNKILGSQKLPSLVEKQKYVQNKKYKWLKCSTVSHQRADFIQRDFPTQRVLSKVMSKLSPKKRNLPAKKGSVKTVCVPSKGSDMCKSSRCKRPSPAYKYLINVKCVWNPKQALGIRDKMGTRVASLQVLMMHVSTEQYHSFLWVQRPQRQN